MKKCPVCGASVKLENLEKHVRNQHPHEDVDTERLVTVKERKAIREKAARPPISPRGLRVIVGIVVILILVFAVAILNPFGREGPGVGQVAPDFTLTSSTGTSLTLSLYRGEPTLLEFMDVDCPHCINEAHGSLPSAYRNYSARVHFLSVDVNFVPPSDDNAKINAFKATHGTPWTYALDTAGVTGKYGVTGTPTTFILDRNGLVVSVINGEAPAGAATYSAALDKALQV